MCPLRSPPVRTSYLGYKPTTHPTEWSRRNEKSVSGVIVANPILIGRREGRKGRAEKTCCNLSPLLCLPRQTGVISAGRARQRDTEDRAPNIQPMQLLKMIIPSTVRPSASGRGRLALDWAVATRSVGGRLGGPRPPAIHRAVTSAACSLTPHLARHPTRRSPSPQCHKGRLPVGHGLR